MITPIFRLDQDDEYLYVYLTTPNLCLTDGEIFYEETDFLFYAKPYYLRLELPASVQPSQKAITDNDDKEKSLKYDTDKNELCVPVPKKNRGEHFTNLDMLTKLLTGPKTNASKKLVEVIDSGLEAVVDIDEDDDFDWNIEQELPTDEFTGSTLLGTEGYGFARRKTGIIEKIGIEAKEICDIKEPGKKSISERRELRILDEESKFSEDHYLADLYDTESIEPFLKSIAPWDNWHNKDIFTDDDRQRMIDRLKKVDLPKYDNTTRKSLLLSVVDILFAYAYDLRTNDFEHSVESAWTIRKLSPTLSWFEHWIRQKSKNSAQEVLSTCVRRSLVYPLYRNWLLALKIIEDVTAILSLGRNAVLKCFLGKHLSINTISNLFTF